MSDTTSSIEEVPEEVGADLDRRRRNQLRWERVKESSERLKNGEITPERHAALSWASSLYSLGVIELEQVDLTTGQFLPSFDEIGRVEREISQLKGLQDLADDEALQEELRYQQNRHDSLWLSIYETAMEMAPSKKVRSSLQALLGEKISSLQKAIDSYYESR